MKAQYSQTIAKQSDTTYTDAGYHVHMLTVAEVAYFNSIAQAAIASAGVDIEIVTRDLEKVHGQENSLGAYWYAVDGSKSFITIDNYHIHDRYEIEVLGKKDYFHEISLAETICHELAHTQYHNHTKGHAALTASFLATMRSKGAKSA